MRILVDNAYIFDNKKRVCLPGRMLIRDGKVGVLISQTDIAPEADAVIDARGACVLPGLVDVHTHGRAGEDFNFADRDAMKKMARSYAKIGTTSLFPTLASAPFDELCNSAKMLTEVRRKTEGAAFLGIHLEGRYLNPAKRGAHDPSLIVPPDAAELERFITCYGLPLHISAALELDRDHKFAEAAKTAGATLGLGHTCAAYAEAMEAFRMYGVSFTHLYNAMPPLHHRDGGPVLAAFDAHAYAELICDGLHIDPSVVAFTYRNVGRDRLVLITDSMAAAGAPDGDYVIAGSPALVRGGIARTPEGALAGSTLDLYRAVENLAAFCNIPLCDALVCATSNPAAEVGLSDVVGTLKPGARADFIITEPDFEAKNLGIGEEGCRVFVGGEEI